MKDRCFAKINLCLDVAGKRSDGYHELKMVMVPIDFYDVLEMIPSNETKLETNKVYLPVNEKNSIIKAFNIMKERYHLYDNFTFRLQKHIPTRAGLAGGSADAASVIRMLDAYYGLGMNVQEKIEVGKMVGSDVPFCLINKPAMVEGTGDIIMPFTCYLDFELLLVKPKKGVSTKEAFELVDSQEPVHPDCNAVREGLILGDYQKVVNNLGNSLEAASLTLVEEIKEVKEKMIALGFDGVLMSGSGSTVFGISQSSTFVNNAMKKLKKQEYFVRRTKILRG